MRRYILTGTPGCGKTALLRALEIMGHPVVEEAATDIIAYQQAQGILKPWENPSFIDHIVHLQKQRQLQQINTDTGLQFYDRSPICTYALAVYLKFKPSETLLEEIQRLERETVYKKQVFFIENLGFCAPTDARKISFEESLEFEKIHEDSYLKFGFECIKIPAGPIHDRVNGILSFLQT